MQDGDLSRFASQSFPLAFASIQSHPIETEPNLPLTRHHPHSSSHIRLRSRSLSLPISASVLPPGFRRSQVEFTFRHWMARQDWYYSPAYTKELYPSNLSLYVACSSILRFNAFLLPLGYIGGLDPLPTFPLGESN